MNQAASATGRPPAGSTAAASCCPVFSPFFMNTFAPQASLLPPPSAQPCFLGTQATQIQPITSIQPPSTNQQQLNTVSQRRPTVSQQSTVPAQTERSQQARGPQDQSINIGNINNNYSTSLTAQTLSLQHLLANRHIPATNYMALAAAALATASFPHFQQLHPNHQIHQSSTSSTSTNDTTTINQANTNSTSVTTNDSVSSLPSSNSNAPIATVTNQVPLINFNSYSAAPQNLNIPAPNAPQPPPVAAHLNHGNSNQQSSLTSTSQLSGEVNGQSRPLATNTLMSDAENQQQQISTAYRRTPAAQTTRQQPQQLNTPAPPQAQHMAQIPRTALNDETINSLVLNEQIRTTMILNLIASNPFAASLGQVPMPHQHTTQPQFSLPNQLPTAPTQQVPASFVAPPRLEQVSSQQQSQQQMQQQAISQPATRLAQAPVAPDPLQSSIGGIYQQSQHATAAVNQQQSQAHSEQNVQAQPSSTAQQSVPAQQQPTQTIPSMPFYPMPQLEQALALISDTQNLSQLFTTLYYQSNGLRPEQHTHHNPPHHFHPHLHGPHHHHHHHHHHGTNGQGNGQDTNLPVDSLAISESKPKGLNRAEIDSLTHYIHTDEKDARTCVICLSKFELKSKIRPLSCNHAFHAKCVDKWLRTNRTCPICRRDALKTYEGKIKRI